jgi:hypothetical protein
MRKLELLANMIVLVGPIVLAVGMGLYLPLVRHMPEASVWAVWGLYAAGFALFLAAKVSVIGQGVLVSFGSSRMSRRFRWCYRLGCALMMLGALLPLVLAALAGSDNAAARSGT